MIMTALFFARLFVVHAHLRMGADDLRASSAAESMMSGFELQKSNLQSNDEAAGSITPGSELQKEDMLRSKEKAAGSMTSGLELQKDDVQNSKQVFGAGGMRKEAYGSVPVSILRSGGQDLGGDGKHEYENDDGPEASHPVILQAYRNDGSQGEECTARRSKGVLAVVLVGLLERLVLDNKLEYVVAAAAEQGYQVHIYFSMVANGAGNGVAFLLQDQRSKGKETNLQLQSLRDRVTAAGGCLRFAEVLNARESLNIGGHKEGQRFKQYDPVTSKVGRNVLRRFLSLEKTMHQILSDNPQGPDLVLVTRDSDMWMHSLNLTFFEQDREQSHKVYAKNCMTFGGLNDKTLVFGREAGKKVLSTIYSKFWSDDKALVTDNAEQFIERFISHCGMKSQGINFDALPTVDGIYSGDRLCVVNFYACAEVNKYKWACTM